jgi:hypothetical protein
MPRQVVSVLRDREYPHLANLHFSSHRALAIHPGATERQALTSNRHSHHEFRHKPGRVMQTCCPDFLTSKDFYPSLTSQCRPNVGPINMVIHNSPRARCQVLEGQRWGDHRSFGHLSVTPHCSRLFIDAAADQILNVFMLVPLLEHIIGSCAKLFGSTLDVLNVEMDEEDLETGLHCDHRNLWTSSRASSQERAQNPIFSGFVRTIRQTSNSPDEHVYTGACLDCY